ncbi:telomere length regulation protein TEL2-like isoform 1, partial [Silurus meridionalis]
EEQLRVCVRACVRSISTSRDPTEIGVAVLTLSRYLEDGAASAEDRSEFQHAHYTHVLQALTSTLKSDWFSSLGEEKRRELWDVFFLRGPPDQALLVLLDSISSQSESSALERCVSVLEEFLHVGRVGVLLWSRCLDTDSRCDSAHLREVVLTRVASLPALAANRLGTRAPSALTEEQYYTHLTLHLIHTLERICSALRAGQDCSVVFVAQLLGKVCMQGHGELVFKTLAPHLSSLTHSDALWRRVSCKLLENVPERWVESVITPLIHNLCGSSALSRVMGNLVLKNKKVQFLLTHKLLLLQYHHSVQVLRSVFGYLAMDKERRPLLKQVLCSVCQVWCNSSAVRHTTVEQQLYVSKSLLLCLCLLHHDEIPEIREDLLQCMLGGVQCRLDSGVERVRRMGMVVGECISRRLDTSTSQLKFQYEADEESRELQSLMEPQSEEDEELPPAEATHIPQTKCESSSGQMVTSQHPVTKQTSGPGSDSELDSDDDLTPYDMSADQVKRKVTAPRYVRDCLEALMTSDDPERVESSLQAADGLLRRNISTTREVSVQFSKVLLHLEDRYNITCFYTLRQNAMVSLVVTDTQPVIYHTHTHTHARSQAVQLYRYACTYFLKSLFRTVAKLTGNKSTALITCTPSICSTDFINFLIIKNKNYLKKTNKKNNGVSQPHKSTPNRYSPVAGYFFFPLLRNYDRPQVTFDLLGSDHLVLGRLVHTLGLLMHLAINAPVATQMGKALLDFVWVLRFHADQMVRRGVLFSVCAVLLSMPSEILLLELSDDLVETRSWLVDVAETDTDADCRSLAVQCLLLLEKSLKTHLQNPMLKT